MTTARKDPSQGKLEPRHSELYAIRRRALNEAHPKFLDWWGKWHICKNNNPNVAAIAGFTESIAQRLCVCFQLFEDSHAVFFDLIKASTVESFTPSAYIVERVIDYGKAFALSPTFTSHFKVVTVDRVLLAIFPSETEALEYCLTFGINVVPIPRMIRGELTRETIETKPPVDQAAGTK